MEKVIQVVENSQVGKTPEGVMRSFNPPQVSKPKKGMILMVIVGVLVILGGVGTGWLLSEKIKAGQKKSLPNGSNKLVEKKNGEVSVKGADESLFSDTAKGVIRVGGIEDEGTHHLDRNLGPGKDVYLFSTSINLDDFIGKRVQVWGKTVSGKKAGWLMDVGRVKIIE